MTADSSQAPATSALMRVDRIACIGVGICAMRAPDLVSLDPWGYPIVEASLSDSQLNEARAAVKGCPKRALALAWSAIG